jgi:hypothetical protein
MGFGKVTIFSGKVEVALKVELHIVFLFVDLEPITRRTKVIIGAGVANNVVEGQLRKLAL